MAAFNGAKRQFASEASDLPVQRFESDNWRPAPKQRARTKRERRSNGSVNKDHQHQQEEKEKEEKKKKKPEICSWPKPTRTGKT